MKTNEQLKQIKQFKSYLAKRGYKFKSESVHLLAGVTLRAEVQGLAKQTHFSFVKHNRSNSVVDLYLNSSELQKITEGLL